MTKKIIERGLQCGNRVALTIAASGSQPNSVEYPTPEIIIWTTWRVLLCSTCSQSTLQQGQKKSRLSSLALEVEAVRSITGSIAIKAAIPHETVDTALQPFERGIVMRTNEHDCVQVDELAWLVREATGQSARTGLC
jgi:hypothetical protein